MRMSRPRKQTPSVPSTSKGDDCVQMFLPLTCGAGRTRMGASLTCGSDATPVLLRPCSLIALRAALYLPPLHATRAASPLSALVGRVPKPTLLGIKGCGPILPDNLLSPVLLHPTSPFIAELMDPLAVRSQARLPRCSSVCGCATPKRSGVLLSQDSSDNFASVACLQSCNRCF